MSDNDRGIFNVQAGFTFKSLCVGDHSNES